MVALCIPLLATPVFGQGTPVPRPGPWIIDAETSAPGFGRIQDTEPIGIQVSACGDEVYIVHPQIYGAAAIILEYDEGAYRGGGQFRGDEGGIGTMEVELTAVRENLMRGRSIIGAGGMRQDWTMTVRTDPDPNPDNFGSGRLRKLGTDTFRDGIFVDETLRYQLILADFDPNSYELLVLHEKSLNDAVLVMRHDRTGVVSTAERQYCGFSSRVLSIEGFADLAGVEKENWQTLARARANVTANYFQNADIGAPRPTINADHDYTGAPGRRTKACMRAAVAEFEKTEHYAEPYSEADMEEWLEDWLSDADEWPEDERVYERRKAKNAYCLAGGLLERLKDNDNDRCRNSESLAQMALGGENGGTKSRMMRVWEGMEDAMVQGEAAAASEGDRRSLEDDGPALCSANVKQKADAIEEAARGEVTSWGDRNTTPAGVIMDEIRDLF